MECGHKRNPLKLCMGEYHFSNYVARLGNYNLLADWLVSACVTCAVSAGLSSSHSVFPLSLGVFKSLCPHAGAASAPKGDLFILENERVALRQGINPLDQRFFIHF